MEVLARTYIPRMFDSVILESRYDAAYTTVHHTDCGFTFGGKWKRNYNYSNGYTTAAKYFTCPNCGVHSEPHRDRIFQTIFESSLVPLSVWAEVVELKDAIDLRISYKAITLNMDGTSVDEGIRKEVLRFDFKKKKAVYTDYNRQKYDLTPDYIREHYFMQVLEYFGKSYAMHSINKKPLNDLFRVLRVAFQKRLLATYGYSAADVYISPSANEEGGYHFTMLLNMVLKISASAKPNIEAGGLAYLKSLPKREQERILGVNGRNLVMNGHASWTEEARGWDGAVFKSRLPVIESLKDYIKNGKINIEDFSKRREFETIDDVRHRVIDYINSPYFNSSYVMRQSMHIKGGKLYDKTQNKSYYNHEIPHADVIKAIQEGVYSGIRFTRKGDWNHKIMVDISPHIGYDVNARSGTKQKTSLATVHVSGKGIHIVPKGSERK